MRHLIGIAIIVGLFSACKSNDTSGTKDVEDISSLQRDDEVYRIICTDGSRQTIRIDEFRTMDPEDICPRSNGGGDDQEVSLFGGNNCQQDQYVGSVSPRTECSDNNRATIYSVQFGDRCETLANGIRYIQACKVFGNVEQAVELHSSNSCSGSSLIGLANKDTDCEELRSNAPNYYVEGVRIRNGCIGLPSSMRVKNACEVFKNWRKGGRELHSETSCSGSTLIATVNEGTNCESLTQNAPNYYVTAVKDGDKCHQLPTNLRVAQACKLFKVDGENSLHSQDNCQGSSYLTPLSKDMNCDEVQQVAPNYYVTAVMFKDRCEKLASNLRVAAACKLFKNDDQRITLYSEQDCRSGSLLGPVGDDTNCEQLRENTPNYYVSGARLADETCQGFVTNLRVKQACEVVKNSDGRTTSFYSESDCRSTSFMGAINETTNCTTFKENAPNYYVMGVKINGRCRGLAQSQRVEQACTQFKNR